MTAPALRKVDTLLAGDPWTAGDEIPVAPLRSGRARLRVLRPPGAVPAPVHRPRLVDVLADPGAPPVATLVAPAGYGKTTLLLDWAAQDERPFAWVTLDRRHEEDGRLRVAVAHAVENAVAGNADTPFVLVLDDVHVLKRPAAIEALCDLADELAPTARLVIASRLEAPLRIARMRLERRVLELGPGDLAMNPSEGAALLKALGRVPDRDDLEALLHRTEGWPAGLAIAVLALDEPGTSATRFGGADRLVARYVRDEVLSGLTPGARELLLHSSVADTLTAPLCDALLQRPGSEATLAELARDGHLVALDRTEQCYRHHRLVAGTLRRELRRHEPELVPELHRRASAWHQQAGDVERALHHALLAGEVAGAGDMVWAGVAPAVGAGRSAAIERWLGRFTEAQIAAVPKLALTAAGAQLMRGQGHLAEHWLAAAAVASARHGSEPTVDAGVLVMRAALGADTVARMGEQAARACALEPGDGPWRPLCCLVRGSAHELVGAWDEAAMQLHEGARRSAVAAPYLHALCLAQLAVLAFERGDWEDAAELVTRARSQVERHGLGGYATTALVFAVSAVVQAQRGRTDVARGDLRAAAALQAMLTHFPAWYEAEVAVLLARAALRLGDLALGRHHLAASARLVRRVPDAVVLHAWLAGARDQLEACTAADGAPPAAMTVAELRVLAYLPTHLSFREIAARLYVSANTVKTQANAVYRKLGVTCRSDAVERAQRCGLLDA